MPASVSFSQSGSFSNIENFLAKITRGEIYQGLEALAEQGVNALASMTPERTGKTAASWSYSIESSTDTVSIYWTNNDIDYQGTPIVILLNYGHHTGSGGYVQGKNFIQPAIQPIMDAIADQVWKAVTG